MNRPHRELLLVENDMSDIADAIMALDQLHIRLRVACRRPALSLDDLDTIGQALRRIEAGLHAGRRSLRQERDAL